MQVRAKTLKHITFESIPDLKGFKLQNVHIRIMQILLQQEDFITAALLYEHFSENVKATISDYLRYLVTFKVLEKISPLKYEKGKNFDFVWEKIREKGN